MAQCLIPIPMTNEKPNGKESFGAELSRVWRQMPFRAALLVLFVAWTALFHSLGVSTFGYAKTHSMFGWWWWVHSRGILDDDGNLVSVWNVFKDEEGYAWLIPLVVLALLWRRREEWLAMPKGVWWPALGLFLGAVLLHVVGYVIQQERVAVAAYLFGLYGLTCLVWGAGWARLAFFPFALFVFCVPLGPSAGEAITFPLRLLATKLTAGLSHTVLGINVIREGTQLFNPSGAYKYEVAAACGGLKSLTVVVAFAIIFGYLNFKSFWRRFALLAAAVPLAVLANVVRLTMIIVTAETFGQKAGNFVHENWFFSLVPYVISFGGLLAVNWWLREDRRPRRAAEPVALEGARQGL